MSIPSPVVRHFIDETDLTANEFRQILDSAIELKKERQQGVIRDSLRNKTLAMIFEKASTRTRTSFEAGMVQLGGHAINLSPTDSQLGRGEPIADTSRVLSEMVDAAMLRTHSHKTIEDFAHVSRIPVINGLSDRSHPCQLLADMQTLVELRGDIKGARIAWLGSGNNMCNSYITTARLLDFTLTIACPKELAPDNQLLTDCAAHVELYEDAESACKSADAVVTDVWASMGEEKYSNRLHSLLKPYQVTQALMNIASPDAVFMHCLPAHRGEEVTEEVIDGKRSVVWREAGNRLHAQKALLEFLLL
ncbi:ornithine carbamoyltransferase [Chromatiales bacterium (ex Bugula neritina AB1)]|nr:ornithine carbamoyltransferase [Chromatiales bacterium (ex Bugula neritina AB1)]